MLELWLVRHGQTDWNINRRFQGSSDIPLNDIGKAQAAALMPRLQAQPWHAIYASNLSRAYETATIALGDAATIAPGDAATIQADARLREIAFGKFEGLTWDEIRSTYPEEFSQWVQDRNNNTHGGEKASDAIMRVQAFLDAITTSHPQDDEHRVLVVSHGGTIGILCALLLGTNPQEWWRYRLHNTSITQFEMHERGNILVRLNDDRHLPPESEPTS